MRRKVHCLFPIHAQRCLSFLAIAFPLDSRTFAHPREGDSLAHAVHDVEAIPARDVRAQPDLCPALERLAQPERLRAEVRVRERTVGDCGAGVGDAGK